MTKDVSSAELDALPSIFACVAALLQVPACDPGYLYTVVEALIDELENSSDSVSYEFAPFVMSLLVESERQAEVSDRALDVLQSYARNAAARSIFRDHIMSQVADRFASDSVRAVLLKGAAMDTIFYARDAFRLGYDVDILVSSADFSRVDEVLSGLASNIEKTPGKPATTAFAVEKTFAAADAAPVQLDVHREVTVPHVFPIDYDELFGRCIPHPVFGGELKRLSDEDNLLQFAMHSFYDMQMFSKQTIDAYMLLEKGTVDLDELVVRAGQYRVLLPLRILLEGVGRVFSSVLPDSVNDALALKGPRKWLAYRLLTGNRRMFMQPGLGFRLRQLAAQFFLSGNLMGWLRYYVHYAGVKVRDLNR